MPLFVPRHQSDKNTSNITSPPNLIIAYIPCLRWFKSVRGKELTKQEREDYLNRLADYGLTEEEDDAMTSIMDDLGLDW